MEKTIEIDGKRVTFKNSAKVLMIYKSQTGRDLLSDFQRMQKPEEDIDSETLCSLAWSMAKAADSATPSLEEWLDDFEIMSLFKALPEIYSLMNASLQADRKNA